MAENFNQTDSSPLVLDGFSCAILKAVQSDGDTPKAPGGDV
jgi:hypothetical protein